MTVRPTDEGVVLEDSSRIVEVDLAIAQYGFALFRVPTELTNACEKR
jgi:hypothetical protein